MIDRLRQLLAEPLNLGAVGWSGFRWPQARLRMIDAVIVAAAAMLVLKAASLFDSASAPEVPPTRARAAPQGEDLPSFARVLARARSNYEVPEVAMTGAVPPKKDAPAEPPAARDAPKPAVEPATKPESPAERALLERLGERRDQLQQRSRDMETRERLIESAERKLETRINDLKALEGKAQDPSGKRGEGEAGLRTIVTMYEAMKPKEAARVFDRLSLDVLVPVVLQMNPRKMAEVLALMNPDTAGKLTSALANKARGVEAPRGPGAAAPAPGLPSGELPAVESPAGRLPR